MRGHRGAILAILAAGLAAAWSAPALGQVGGRPRGPVAPGAPVVPFSPIISANPAFSPYWAAAPAGTVDDATGTLLMLSVVSSQTGLGSGQLSGVRGVRGGSAGPAVVPGSVMRPGGTAAARYYERGTGAPGGAGRYYGRHNRHFMNNGR